MFYQARKHFMGAFLGTILLMLTRVIAEVSILSKVQTLYDRSPKLRIKASGVIAEEHDISIVMVIIQI